MSVFEKEYINNLLNEKQIKLPDDFYNYLTQISSNHLIFYYNDVKNDENYKEICKIPKFYDSNYKYPIDLKYLPSYTHPQVSIPLNVTRLSYYFPEVKYSEDDIERTTNNNISINDVRKWMLNIAFGNSYSFFPYYIYLGNGPHFGSIWINYDDSCYLEYPEFTKVFTSFDNFLKSVNEYKNNNDSDSDNDSDSPFDCKQVLLCEL